VLKEAFDKFTAYKTNPQASPASSFGIVQSGDAEMRPARAADLPMLSSSSMDQQRIDSSS